MHPFGPPPRRVRMTIDPDWACRRSSILGISGVSLGPVCGPSFRRSQHHVTEPLIGIRLFSTRAITRSSTTAVGRVLCGRCALGARPRGVSIRRSGTSAGATASQGSFEKACSHPIPSLSPSKPWGSCPPPHALPLGRRRSPSRRNRPRERATGRRARAWSGVGHCQR